MNYLNYTLLIFCLVPIGLWGQPKWEWSLFGGGANYLGDLVEEKYPILEESKPAVGLAWGYNMTPSWSIRANAFYGIISGNDKNFSLDKPAHLSRNFAFESQLMEFSLLVRWEPFGNKRYPEIGGHQKIISPYLFLGGGYVSVEPKTNFQETPRDGLFDRIQEDKMVIEEPVSNFVMPFGGGLRLDVSKRSSIGLELGLRMAFNDYLDGVSISGNSDKNDWFMFGGIIYSLRIGNHDRDGDGIVDKKDACPGIAGVASANGCPDADEDGVEDLEDVCPFNAGPVELNGCPDADGDLVIDIHDACPKIPGKERTNGCPDADDDGIVDDKDDCPQAAGTIELGGCPDTDEDGIIDKDDECPEEAGIVEKNGCPFIDTDEDGVEDEVDKCPEVKGRAETNGCPDRDEDGIFDEVDKCPDDKGTEKNEGCPEITEAAIELLDFATRAVKFETGSAVLKAASLKILDQVVELMGEFEAHSLNINGHTDSQGNDQNNQTLSEKRAKACFDYMITKKIDKTRMTHEGFGETKPIGDNKTATGRKLNRRVEFRLFIPDRE